MTDTAHKAGCDALGGYGHGAGACSCDADTWPLAPTDAEIAALVPKETSWEFDIGTEEAIRFARAVLALQGAQPVPASAAEFALRALVAAGHVSQELVDQALALPGAPRHAYSGGPVNAKSFQTYGETRAYSKGYYAGKKAALAAQPSTTTLATKKKLKAYITPYRAKPLQSR